MTKNTEFFCWKICGSSCIQLFKFCWKEVLCIPYIRFKHKRAYAVIYKQICNAVCAALPQGAFTLWGCTSHLSSSHHVRPSFCAVISWPAPLNYCSALSAAASAGWRVMSLLSCVQEMVICFCGEATSMASWLRQSPSCPLPLLWIALCWAERKLSMYGVVGRTLLLKQVKRSNSYYVCDAR